MIYEGLSGLSESGLKAKTDEFRGRIKDATASLEDVFSPDMLTSARSYSMTLLESGVLLNDGKGVFSRGRALTARSAGTNLTTTASNDLPQLSCSASRPISAGAHTWLLLCLLALINRRERGLS